MRVGWLPILLGALGVLGPRSASTTSTPEMSLSELTRRSPHIVYGTVVTTTSHWNEDHSLIVTEARVRVEETLRGRPSDAITVVQPGGRVGKLRVDVDGAAALVDGEEAILFLAPGTSGTWQLVGLQRGRYRVERNPVTGEKRVQGVTLQSFLAHVREITRDLPREVDH